MTEGDKARSASSFRMHWIDFAKALAIVLVVFYHVGGAGMDILFPNPSGPGSIFWTNFNTIFLPLRMPLFFVAAGILANAAMARPWNAVVGPRILTLIWPYILWTVAFACIAWAAYRPEDPFGYVLGRLAGLPFAQAGYWFLPVLSLFFIMAKLLRRWAPFVLAMSLVLAATSPWLEASFFPFAPPITVYVITRIARYAFWYFLGCYALRYVSRVAGSKPFVLVAGGGTMFVALSWMGVMTDASTYLSFALSVTGVTAMIGVSVWVSGFDSTRSFSRYIAARSLPIYLIHPIIIVLVIIVGRYFGGAIHANDMLATWLTPVLVVLALVVSVLVYDSVSKSNAGWIFAPPAWTDRIIEPLFRRGS